MKEVLDYILMALKGILPGVLGTFLKFLRKKTEPICTIDDVAIGHDKIVVAMHVEIPLSKKLSKEEVQKLIKTNPKIILEYGKISDNRDNRSNRARCTICGPED